MCDDVLKLDFDRWHVDILCEPMQSHLGTLRETLARILFLGDVWHISLVGVWPRVWHTEEEAGAVI